MTTLISVSTQEVTTLLRMRLTEHYLNGSPTGLIPSTMCRLARTRSMRNAYMAAGVSSTPDFLAASVREFRTYTWKTTPSLLLG